MTKSSLRNKYGEGYFTAIDDNTIISWKPLPIGEFFHYDSLMRQAEVLPVVLEDEIFIKCVTNKELIKRMDNLPFGTVSIVVQNIMEHSGPLSIQHFNDSLEANRSIASEPIHYMATLIIRAFPAYTLEAIYSMPFDIFILRLAQAEQFLLRIQAITEPIALVDANTEPPVKQKPVPAELRAIWDRQQREHGINEPTVPPPLVKDKPKKPIDNKPVKFTPPDQSPIFVAPEEKRKQLAKQVSADRVEIEQAAASEEKNEERATMLRDAARVYGPVMERMDYYKK